ncbi:hypothetical protein DSS3P1_09 [Ruegeria phage DSS3-P1]|uniref:hypothetical protein n=1 Tax=Ruegeria phage DSS3-P1 TaxID=1555208 RepID=UPI0002357D8C|nr:hypothetical protein DSS3P1_09 [Ruegeria phage DSS3-P1]YP_009997225.1 hypothetical protein JT312_gp08 [Ruegeria phage vB_RpoS-V18]YP_009997307.1 hypothetical protein JT313_gp08 [Ruegeria phage vB_RpoS-V11]YP_009997390.1 hypothetical protein JT314_gp09 [Ruegeria phage vB_RpoS-V7]AET42328.1 hypothetical protein SDSG_00063 [Ruegeria phage DSS3-P1]AIT13244.1 hypothetical protein DSS3P1_09 [Ruegeria phage DSS3-P1]AWY08712.1 hypothetical protein vBRpoSV7_09 [Ruegeria phage vB_RpoS-V7]AWY08884.1
MATNYETREIHRRAALAALHGLAETLPGALAKATGVDWRAAVELIPADWHPDLTGPERVRAVTLTRETGDGFAIELRPDGAWNAPGKATAAIVPPIDPTAKGAYSRVNWGSARSVAYGSAPPSIGFSPDKAKPETLARRIARDLVTPEFTGVYAELCKIARDRGDSSATAAEWRARVSEAAGIGCHESDSGFHWHNKGGPKWGHIETQYRDLPGGKLRLELPVDPGEAAALVADIRAAVEARTGKGESR